MAGSSKSISTTTHSPPSRSLDFSIRALSNALMNFLAFFHEVFLMFKVAACAEVVIGRKGRTRLETRADWLTGKLKPWCGFDLLVFR